GGGELSSTGRPPRNPEISVALAEGPELPAGRRNDEDSGGVCHIAEIRPALLRDVGDPFAVARPLRIAVVAVVSTGQLANGALFHIDDIKMAVIAVPPAGLVGLI